MTTVPAQKEDRVVFACNAAGQAVRDIVDAAYFRAEIAAPWRAFLQRGAAEQHANEVGAEVQGSSIDEAAVAFRYEYDLITAEETEAWLEERALTLNDFGDYFSRAYWAKTFPQVEPAQIAFAEASLEQRDAFTAELIFSGELDRMAQRLAWRMAARAARNDEVDEAAIARERARFLQRHELTSAAVADWIDAIGRGETWLDEMLALEAAYAMEGERLLTPENIRRELASLRIPLTRLELETIEVESRDAANEALMCVREDGMSLEEVAREGRYPFSRTTMPLEQIAPEQQQKFLSVTTGTVLDPIPREGGFVLSRLIAKHEPAPDDPQVRARIEERILQRHFTDLSSGRIQWSLLPHLAE